MSSEHLYSEETKKILEFADEIMRLKAEVKKLVEALQHIANPIKYMQDNLEPGYTLDGGMAMQMSQSASYLKGIAEEALKPYQK